MPCRLYVHIHGFPLKLVLGELWYWQDTSGVLCPVWGSPVQDMLMTAPCSAEGHQDVGLEYVKHEKLGKLGLFSMQRSLRGELTTDFNNYGGDGAVFSRYAQQKDKKLEHKLEEGKFQIDIRKKRNHSESG